MSHFTDTDHVCTEDMCPRAYSEGIVLMNSKGQIEWKQVADLTKDERAWLLAKVAAVPGEPIRDTITRAQDIKETL